MVFEFFDVKPLVLGVFREQFFLPAEMVLDFQRQTLKISAELFRIDDFHRPVWKRPALYSTMALLTECFNVLGFS